MSIPRPKVIDEEYLQLEGQIHKHLPENERLEAVENLNFVVTAAYLRGQRDILLEQQAKRNAALSNG